MSLPVFIIFCSVLYLFIQKAFLMYHGSVSMYWSVFGNIKCVEHGDLFFGSALAQWFAVTPHCKNVIIWTDGEKPKTSTNYSSVSLWITHIHSGQILYFPIKDSGPCTPVSHNIKFTWLSTMVPHCMEDCCLWGCVVTDLRRQKRKGKGQHLLH